MSENNKRNDGGPRGGRPRGRGGDSRGRGHGAVRRDGERRPRRDGEFRRDGERRPRRDGEFRRDGERRPRRDGDFRRDGERGQRQERFGRGGTRGGGRSDRAGRDRTFTEAERLQHELRPVREAHTDPEIPEEVQARQLPPQARNELKTLDKHLGDLVARHLVMAAELIHVDPDTAHAHAVSASRRAGRIPVTRETLAMTAYVRGDYAMALRELRTYRRLSGRNDHLAIMIDCERGLGRPERGLELARETDRSGFKTQERVHTAIALSGARLDLGQTEQALIELEIPELNPSRAFPWSAELFRAYAAVLEDLGRADEAAQWETRATVAERAVHEAQGGDQLNVIELEEVELEAAEAAESVEASQERKPEEEDRDFSS